MPGAPAHDSFALALARAIDALGTPACVGLDPVLERLPTPLIEQFSDPVDAIEAFCTDVIDAVAGVVPVIKPQSACFERFGPRGVASLHWLCQHARRRGLIVVLDAKRGDIGVTAEHYAAAVRATGAHAVTLSGYMGPDTIEPFLKAIEDQPPLGVFVLVRTSNPGSDAVQSLRLSDGRTVAELLADTVHTLGQSRTGAHGLSDVGAVVGATKGEDIAALRARMPSTIFLIPGYGAQGGTLADVARALRPERDPARAGTFGVLVNASRSVLYPTSEPGEHWRDAIARAARTFASELSTLATITTSSLESPPARVS